MHIGEMICQIRKSIGMTQAELATKMGVTPQTISQYERGLKNPKPKTIEKFANALDVDAAELYAESITQQAAKALREMNTLPEITAGYVQNIANNALRNIPETAMGAAQSILNAPLTPTDSIRKSITSSSSIDLDSPSKIKPVPLSTGESTSNEQLLLLQEYFLALNSTGREKALERLRELTEIPRYTSAPSDETTDTPTAPRSPAGNNSPSQD